MFVTLSLVARAQSDTIYLQEVKVYGLPISRYTSGSKVQHISGKEKSTTLTDFLGNESSLYFKNYGNGQLSTIAFRGTSASHTAVLWNGINVNSPTLGLTDFSLWPSFLLDEVSLQYGAGSALYGTDALGGSVILAQSTPQFNKRNIYILRQEVGSFGHWLSGLHAVYGNTRVEYRTKIFYRSLENDFKYTSPKVGYEKTQQHASVQGHGVDQQLHWKISEHRHLAAEAMYTYNFREIQQPVTNNDPGEVLKDQNTRVSLSYTEDFRKGGSLFTTLGYIKNDQRYDRQSTTRSDQITALIQYDRDLGKRSSLKVGSNYTRFFARSNGFTGQISEDRYDIFLSLRHRIKYWWVSNLNLRQALYAGQSAPFVPSWGNEVKALDQQAWKITIRTQLAKAYRVPTLNDRYWIPGGNLELKPEEGINGEIGSELRHQNKKHKISFELSQHQLWVDEWIIWLPNSAGLWTPSNLSKVHVSGIETSLKETLTHDRLIIHGRLSYSFTRSINQEGLNASDVATVDKQLPYIPVHTGNVYGSIERKNWSGEFQWNYTGIRYTTLDNADYQALKAYALVGVALSKRFVLKECDLALRFSGNNLLNTYYETIENRAMPGRNFTMNLTAKF